MWTPFVIDVVLHHHTRWCRHDGANAPIYPETVAELVRQGILAPTDDAREWATTDKGAALVKAWQDTPMPVMRWSDPRFEETRHA